MKRGDEFTSDRLLIEPGWGRCVWHPEDFSNRSIVCVVWCFVVGLRLEGDLSAEEESGEGNVGFEVLSV